MSRHRANTASAGTSSRMKGHQHHRRRRSHIFRRGLLGAVLLAFTALACGCGVLKWLATSEKGNQALESPEQQLTGWKERRGLRVLKESNILAQVDQGSSRTGHQEPKPPGFGVIGLPERQQRGPGRMRKEAERQLRLLHSNPGLHGRGRLVPKGIFDKAAIGHIRKVVDRQKGFESGVLHEARLHQVAEQGQDERGLDLTITSLANHSRRVQQRAVEKQDNAATILVDQPQSKLPPALWSLYAGLARQRTILAEPRLYEHDRISCGGSGTVGFRTWPQLAQSIEEFDMEWPSEEPDLRALVAAAQKKVPDLVHRPSCAVVGNSGRLLQHEHGAEIDSKELVIRFNWGTTAGYEKHVGVKSHVRIYNGPYVSQKQAGEITLAEIRDPALREWVRKKTKEAADHAFAFDPEFLCHVWNWVGQSGDKPSTGLVGVVLALRMCSSVDVFGFHYEDYFDPKIQPHYYDWERPKVGREKAHPFEREYELYRQLESAGMLRLH